MDRLRELPRGTNTIRALWALPLSTDSSMRCSSDGRHSFLQQAFDTVFRVTMNPSMNRLPIEDVLPDLRQALAERSNALLTAPPGAGKTTAIPLALLDEPWLAGQKLLMLEPRRLAAKAAAHRMAATLGESVGQSVGYRMRLDTKIGPRTRIEVVTEGVLTRLLIRNPELEGYGAVLFDEFHERSLQADIGLALALETQRLVRPDLRLLVMSATLNCGPVSDLLGGARVISCTGRTFAVDTRYLDRPLKGPLETAVVQSIRRSLAQDSGSLLVFLPGMAEIRRVERALLDADLGRHVVVAPLHGDLPQAAQDSAIEPALPGMRKVVLATSIAETSLTIEGIRVVIDAGQLRAPRFDPRSGLTRLETIRVTHDSAEQRRGRAGRLEPGVCYRLWTEQEHQTLMPRRTPEILDADLSPLVLDTAQWGVSDPSELSWLTPPPAGAVAQARELLARLGALDAHGRLTPHGRQMGELPLHPRLAHMLLRSLALDYAGLACDLAALLNERDVLRASSGNRQADLRLRLDLLYGHRSEGSAAPVDRRTIERIKRTADLWERQVHEVTGIRPVRKRMDLDPVGLLLAIAYPDRVAQRQHGSEARYLLTNGRGASFAHPDPLAAESYLVIAEMDAGAQWARIDLAAPVSLQEIHQLYGGEIVESEAVVWDERMGAARACRQRRLGALLLSEDPLPRPDPSLIAAALMEGVRSAGLHTLAWTPELQDWRKRVQFLRRLPGEGAASRRRGGWEGDIVATSTWPDVSDERLLDTLEEWLGPYVGGMTTLERVQRMNLATPLHALLSHGQQRELDRLAPTHLAVPSGSHIRVDYAEDIPVLAVRLQEMFGCKDTPRLVHGTVPVMLHLLSPAKRPVQVTRDLGSFWANAYPEVRKELRGRYPKHHWPEDPLTAPPTAKTKKRR
jgi:ATP-dependent helicase HrpB